MVSPFMSFATGALQAVDKNIDRWRESEAAEKEREDADAQRMKELDFARNTQKEIANIAADSRTEAARITAGTADKKNFITLGNLKIPKGKGAEGVTATINYLASVPEQYAAIKKDAVLGPQLQSILANAVLGSRTMAGFYEKVSPMSKTAPRPAILSRLFAPALRNNAELMSDIRALEDSGTGLPPPPNGAAARQVVRGEITHVSDGKWVGPAVKAMEKVRLAPLGRTMPEKVLAVSSMLGEYNPNAGEYEGNNKFWNAASSPFVAFIGRTGPSPKAETEEAMKWINNPAHGFVDVSEQGVITKNEDYFFLVNKFANQAAGKASTIYGDRPKTYTEISGKTPYIKKRVEEIKQTEGLAGRAKRGLTRLKTLTKRSGTGSRITTGLRAGIPGFKEVVADGVSILVEEVIGTAKVKATNLNIDESAKTKYFNPAIEALNEARKSKNQKDIAAAEIRVMEVSLAYQLTSILQGGTGGRTISDQDVKMALELFTGDFITVDQKLAKIDAIMSMVDNTLERAKLYGALRDDSNANYYYAIEKLDRAGLIRQASLDTLRSGELNARLNSMVKVKPAKYQEAGSISQAVDKVGQNAGGKNYKFQTYSDTVTEFLGGAKPLVTENRYIVNMNDARKWENAVSSGDTDTIKRVAKELNQGGKNRVFDGASGTVIPIRWFVGPEGRAEFEPMKEGDPVSRTVSPKNAIGVVPDRVSQEEITGEKTDAITPSVKQFIELSKAGATSSELSAAMKNLPPKERQEVLNNYFRILSAGGN